MHFYAQIDGTGRCFAVTQTAGPVEAADMIPIGSYDPSYIGRVYAGGSWS